MLSYLPLIHALIGWCFLALHAVSTLLDNTLFALGRLSDTLIPMSEVAQSDARLVAGLSPRQAYCDTAMHRLAKPYLMRAGDPEDDDDGDGACDNGLTKTSGRLRN